MLKMFIAILDRVERIRKRIERDFKRPAARYKHLVKEIQALDQREKKRIEKVFTKKTGFRKDWMKL